MERFTVLRRPGEGLQSGQARVVEMEKVKFAKALTVGTSCKSRVRWAAGFHESNQYFISDRGWILIEYFFVRRSSALHSLAEMRGTFTPPHDASQAGSWRTE